MNAAEPANVLSDLSERRQEVLGVVLFGLHRCLGGLLFALFLGRSPQFGVSRERAVLVGIPLQFYFPVDAWGVEGVDLQEDNTAAQRKE